MLATVVVLFVAKELKIVTVPEMSRDIPRKVRDNLPALKKDYVLLLHVFLTIMKVKIAQCMKTNN